MSTNWQASLCPSSCHEFVSQQTEDKILDATDHFQAEREQRYLLKKEMDVKLNSESMYNLGNLALSIHGRGAGLGAPDVEEEDEMVEILTEDPVHSLSRS